MAYQFKWSGGDEDRPDARGSVSELTGTVGLFYIFLICLGILFVALKNLQGQEVPSIPGSSVPSRVLSGFAAVRQRALGVLGAAGEPFPGKVCDAGATKIDA